MCSWVLQKMEWFSIYMLRYQCFGCVNFFSFDVEVQEISENCAVVFGKNGKYALYLDVRHFIEFCNPKKKVT